MDRTCELIRQAKEGNQKAREQLVEENIGLVWSIARRFQGRGYELEDLFQIGSIGLLKCIDGFDLTRGVRFSTYAVPLIIGEIKRFLRDDGMVKVSRSLKELNYRVKKEAEIIKEKEHRDPTLEEIAITLEEDPMNVLMAVESCQDVFSIHQVIYQGDGDEISLEERLEQKDDMIEDTVNNIYLGQLLDKLQEEEKELIKMRYFDNMTQSAIAEKLGISQVQVSRMEKKLLKKMRQLA